MKCANDGNSHGRAEYLAQCRRDDHVVVLTEGLEGTVIKRVQLVSDRATPSDRPTGEATMARPQGILIPTDFSEASNAAKAYATLLAEAFGATLHVLHVIPDLLAMGWGVDAAYLPHLLERTERNVRDQLESMLTPAPVFIDDMT